MFKFLIQSINGIKLDEINFIGFYYLRRYAFKYTRILNEGERLFFMKKNVVHFIIIKIGIV